MEKVCHDLAVAFNQVVYHLLKYWRPTDADGRDKLGHDGRSGAGVAGVGIPHSPASGATGLEIGLSAGDGAAAPDTRSRKFWKTT